MVHYFCITLVVISILMNLAVIPGQYLDMRYADDARPYWLKLARLVLSALFAVSLIFFLVYFVILGKW